MYTNICIYRYIHTCSGLHLQIVAQLETSFYSCSRVAEVKMPYELGPPSTFCFKICGYTPAKQTKASVRRPGSWPPETSTFSTDKERGLAQRIGVENKNCVAFFYFSCFGAHE